jgi:hypothetical protein
MTIRSSSSAGQRSSPDNVPKSPTNQRSNTLPQVSFTRILAKQNSLFSSTRTKPEPKPETSITFEKPTQARPNPDERGNGDESRDPKGESREGETTANDALLDPMQGLLWREGGWARPEGASAPRAVSAAPALAPALDSLVDRFLRRVAFSGGRQRGVAHLEIGSGELAGASLTISSEAGEVELVLDAPPGVDAEPYRALLSKRLAAKGVRATVRVR